MFDELFGSWFPATDRDSVVALLQQHGVTLVAEESAGDPIRIYLREIGKETLLTAEQEVSLSKRMEMGENVIRQVIKSCGATLPAFYHIAQRARSTRDPRTHGVRTPKPAAIDSQNGKRAYLPTSHHTGGR